MMQYKIYNVNYGCYVGLYILILHYKTQSTAKSEINED